MIFSLFTYKICNNCTNTIMVAIANRNLRSYICNEANKKYNELNKTPSHLKYEIFFHNNIQETINLKFINYQ